MWTLLYVSLLAGFAYHVQAGVVIVTNSTDGCPEHYYGTNCDIYCVSNERYICSVNGSKICRNGFQSPEQDCLQVATPNPECPDDGDCINGYCRAKTCVCNPGWRGRFCHIQILGCEPAPGPCLNGGTCRHTAGAERFQCICLPQWTGRYCETSLVPTCTPRDDCSGHYTCNGNIKVCLPGWADPSRDCTVRTIPQPNDPECPIHGFCQQGSCFRGQCCCHQHWDGILCHCKKLYCNDRPCQNGGACRNLVEDYHCTCPPGWTGKNCDQRISED